MARLDRLGAAKEVAQIGATIGRDFSHALLLRIASVAETELDSAIEHLKQNEIIRVIESSPPRGMLSNMLWYAMLRMNRC